MHAHPPHPAQPARWLPRRHFIGMLMLLAMLSGTMASWAENVPRGIEAQVKAAFLYKFCAYVAWPEQSFERPNSPLVIAVIEGDAFADILEQIIAGRNANGHALEVRRLRRGASLADVQIAFVPGNDPALLPEVASTAKGLPVLIVSDVERGLAQGGMINFVVDQDKVRFDIAPAPAEQNNLKISARLLSVARKVVGRASS